jgi:hypothetical protein
MDCKNCANYKPISEITRLKEWIDNMYQREKYGKLVLLHKPERLIFQVGGTCWAFYFKDEE